MAPGRQRTFADQRGEDDLEGCTPRIGCGLDVCRLWRGDGLSRLPDDTGRRRGKPVKAGLPGGIACLQHPVRLWALLQRSAGDSAVDYFGIDPGRRLPAIR